MDDVGYGSGAEDKEGARRVRSVHDLVGVRRARWPARRVAGMEQVGAILLDHGPLSRKHVEELVLLFVPVPVGGARPRLQRMHVGAELGQPALVGKVQPLGGAVHLRIFLVCVIYRCLVISDDHLDPPKVCHARCGSLMLAGGYSPPPQASDGPGSPARKQTSASGPVKG